MNTAMENISQGKAEAFYDFLDRFASQLSPRELADIRSKLITKNRLRTDVVLKGAALKSYSSSKVQKVIEALQQIIDLKKEAGRSEQPQKQPEKTEPKALKKEAKPSLFSAEEATEIHMNPPTADELLAHIESVDISAASSEGFKKASEELENIFKILMLTGRVEFAQGRFTVTEKGQSASTETNVIVNQQLCTAYRVKLEALRKTQKEAEDRERAREEFKKKQEAKKVREAAEKKAQEEAATPGIFEEVKVNGSKLRLYIGKSYSARVEKRRNAEEVKKFKGRADVVVSQLEELLTPKKQVKEAVDVFFEDSEQEKVDGKTTEIVIEKLAPKVVEGMKEAEMSAELKKQIKKAVDKHFKGAGSKKDKLDCQSTEVAIFNLALKVAEEMKDLSDDLRQQIPFGIKKELLKQEKLDDKAVEIITGEIECQVIEEMQDMPDELKRQIQVRIKKELLKQGKLDNGVSKKITLELERLVRKIKDSRSAEIRSLLEDHCDEYEKYKVNLEREKNGAQRSAEEAARKAAKAKKKAEKEAKAKEKAEKDKKDSKNPSKNKSKSKKRLEGAIQKQSENKEDKQVVMAEESEARQLIRVAYPEIEEFMRGKEGEVRQLLEDNTYEEQQYVRVDQVNSGKPVLTKGATFLLDAENMPFVLQKALSIVRQRVLKSIDIDSIIDGIEEYEEERIEEEERLAA